MAISVRHRWIDCTIIGVDHVIALRYFFVVFIDVVTVVAIAIAIVRGCDRWSMLVMMILVPVCARFVFAILLMAVMAIRMAAVRMLAVRFQRMIRAFGGTLIELRLRCFTIAAATFGVRHLVEPVGRIG